MSRGETPGATGTYNPLMSGRIPRSFIDQLLTRVDIVDVIDARVPLKKAGKEYKACCPFHEERTPSFTVSQDKQFYHCFGCGEHGTAIGFLMAYDHMDFPEAVEHLAAQAGMEVPREEGPAARTQDRSGPDLLALLNEASRFYQAQLRKHPDARRAVEYLKNRGVTGATAARFGLGYAPDGWDNLLKALGGTAEGAEAKCKALLSAGLVSRKDGRYYDRFRRRVMFPIQDYRGRVVGFGGRVLGEDEPKYLNSPETPLFHKGAELYGLYAARGAIKSTGRALVVEGYMDVVMLAQAGFDFAVATLGTATTRTHLERLFRYCADVIFCFDGDRAGRAAAWKALETALPVLRGGRQISFLFLPEGQDPDSLVRDQGVAAFQQLLDHATALPDYLLDHLCTQVDLERLDGRARLIELARPHLNRLEPGALKELLIDRVADLARTQRPAVVSALGGHATKRPDPPPGSAPRGPTEKKTPSLEQMALALVIQRPKLARIAHEVDMLSALNADDPETTLLHDVVHAVTEHPGLNTAALLERFRDSERRSELETLAAWSHMIEDEELEDEFRGILQRLKQRAQDAQASRILEAAKRRKLNDEEKARLRELLQR